MDNGGNTMDKTTKAICMLLSKGYGANDISFTLGVDVSKVNSVMNLEQETIAEFIAAKVVSDSRAGSLWDSVEVLSVDNLKGMLEENQADLTPMEILAIAKAANTAVRRVPKEARLEVDDMNKVISIELPDGMADRLALVSKTPEIVSEVGVFSETADYGVDADTVNRALGVDVERPTTINDPAVAKIDIFAGLEPG